MGSVTSALTRTRNALVKVGSEPETQDPERSRSAPGTDRTRKRSARLNVSCQTGRPSSRPSLSDVLSGRDSDAKRNTKREGQPSGESDTGYTHTRDAIKSCL